MNFVVTARKWRPQTFEEVVGQEHISTTLKNALKNNRIAHAYLFTGPRGVGKTTTARILAKGLNCLNIKDGEPCNECEMCQSFLKSETLDIIEIDGASNRRIDEIRALRESVKYAPTKSTYKIYIIDEVHMLTTESFNALLKTLEEPPERTVFIFATTDIHKVPLTIISRCQRFDFRRIEVKNIVNLLKKIAKAENIKIDEKSLLIIAKKADGALRDAQSLFDQVVAFCGDTVDPQVVSSMLNLIDEEVFFEISEAILNKNYKSAFEITQKIYDNGWSFIDFINGLVEHFRNIMTVIIREDSKLIETTDVFKKKYLEYKGKFSEGDLLRISSYLNKVQYELRSAQDQKLKTEISICHLIGLERSSTISELLNKIENSSGIAENIKSETGGGSFSSEMKFNSSAQNFSKQKEIQNKTVGVKPEIQPFTVPAANAELDFEVISERWKFFLSQVSSEKFTFGPILSNAELMLIQKKTKILLIITTII